MPVLSSSSPPDSHGAGSGSSDTWTQRIGAVAERSPAASSSSIAPTRSRTVSIGLTSDQRARRGQHGPQHLLDLGELLAVGDQRRGQLDDGIAAIVRSTDQAVLVELAREEPA